MNKVMTDELSEDKVEAEKLSDILSELGLESDLSTNVKETKKEDFAHEGVVAAPIVKGHPKDTIEQEIDTWLKEKGINDAPPGYRAKVKAYLKQNKKWTKNNK